VIAWTQVFVSLHDDEIVVHPMIWLAMNVAMFGCAHASRMPLQRRTHSVTSLPAHVAHTESAVHPASF